MILKDVKQQIDNFFDNIDAEELYKLSVLKYGVQEFVVIEDSYFESMDISIYQATSNSVHTDGKSFEDDLIIAA